MNLCELFPSNLPIFPRLITVQEIGSKTRPIASEKATEMFINTCIEDPVRETINKLHSLDPNGSICPMGGILDFVYHPRNFDDNPGRVLGPERAPEDTISVRDKDFRPDGLCVIVEWQAVKGRNIVIFTYEVKALHNLEEDDLNAVLKFPNLPDNFWTAKNPGGISQLAACMEASEARAHTSV
ncbi:hypothetical protein E4U26_000753 [Claviceps purpurea]|nr:hypothetical protein E4U26_000753 [Claviceps purpurea]